MPISPAWTATWSSLATRTSPRTMKSITAVPTCPWGEAKYKMPIASIVTPKDCSRCHPDEATQYSKSKHANTIEIMWKLDPWLNKGMNSDNERKTGCFNCHGTVIAIDENGKIDPGTWPNAGVGGSTWTAARGRVPPATPATAFPWPKPASPKPATSATWAPTIPRSRSTKSPNTARSTRLPRTSTISMPPAAPGHRGGLPGPHLRGLPHERIRQGSPPATTSPNVYPGKPRPRSPYAPRTSSPFLPEPTGR
jgi:hypothetical protein